MVAAGYIHEGAAAAKGGAGDGVRRLRGLPRAAQRRVPRAGAAGEDARAADHGYQQGHQGLSRALFPGSFCRNI